MNWWVKMLITCLRYVISSIRLMVNKPEEVPPYPPYYEDIKIIESLNFSEQ